MSQDFTQQTRQSRSQDRPLLVDDSEDELPAKTRRSGTRAGSVVAAKKTTTTRGKKVPVKPQPLFLDDEDENEDEEAKPEPFGFSDIEEMDSIPQTLPSTVPDKRPPRRTAASKSKKAAVAIIVDDDSDEDAFKGFKGRKRR